MKKLKSIFWGTPYVALKALEELNKHSEVKAVICNPDKPSGRKKVLTPPPVKKWLLEENTKRDEKNKILLFQPLSLKDTAFLEALKAVGEIDFALVCAYGKIMPESYINLPRLKTINIHFSLLPKWRGASPVEAGLLAGDKKSGVSFQFINEKMDEGDLLLQKEIVLSPFEQAESLFDKLISLLPEMTKLMVIKLEKGDTKAEKQKHSEATYCSKIKSEDGKIDWKQNAENIYHKIQGLYLRKACHTFFKTKRIKILWALPGNLIQLYTEQKQNGKYFKTELPVTLKSPKGNVQVKLFSDYLLLNREESNEIQENRLHSGQIIALWKDFLLVFSGNNNLKVQNINLNNQLQIPLREILFIEKMQPEGKRELSAGEFFNGSRLEWGDYFSTEK